MNKNIRTNWNLSLLFTAEELNNIEKYRNIISKRITSFIKKWKKDKSYLQKPEKLKEALDEFDEINKKYGVFTKEGYYRWLDRVLDQTNPEKNAAFNQIHEKSTELSNQLQFFYISLSKVSKEKQKEFLKSNLLNDYKHFLEKLFQAADFILSDAEEKIISLFSKTGKENWVSMIDSLLSKQEREVLDENKKKATKNFSELMDLISNKDKDVRDRAAEEINKILKEFKDFAEHEFNSVLEYKKTTDKIRGYKTPREARLLSDDVDEYVVDSLKNSVTDHFKIAKEYYKLKSSLLNTPKLKYHERNVQYGEVDKKYSFEDAYELVGNVFKSLDTEFYDLYRSFFTKGHVDVFPSKGKTGGAFCISQLPNDPIFILLNHTSELRNVLTIAHEFGHAFHTYFSNTHQNALQNDYSLAAAETASTFFEDFVFEEIRTGANDELQLALNMMSLNDEVSTIFRQIAAFNFEEELHKVFRDRGYLSAEEIGNIFQKHMKSYMGKYVEHPDESKNWWIYWSHFRRPFYVYSYAFGLLVSKSLQNKYKNNNSFIGEVKKFLSLGGSKSVKNIFLELDIDITQSDFWDSGINEVKIKLEETKALAKKLGKV